jgi:hypothetical protein
MIVELYNPDDTFQEMDARIQENFKGEHLAVRLSALQCLLTMAMIDEMRAVKQVSYTEPDRIEPEFTVADIEALKHLKIENLSGGPAPKISVAPVTQLAEESARDPEIEKALAAIKERKGKRSHV